MQRFGTSFKALIIGSSGGIGSSFVELLKADSDCTEVVAVSRNTPISLHLENEASIANAADSLKAKGPFDLILVCTGILHDSSENPPISPEKKLGDIHVQQIQKVFEINTFGPAMILRHFTPLLSKNNSVMALLSAKVGSIEDNRLGGWYSYRASKAALNMLIKTAAIEVARTNPNTSLIALHPGTVNTSLSKPFGGEIKGQNSLEAASKMLAALDRHPANSQASFLSYDGNVLPW
jgi:NAD(P)-dependent dehydrogenase (short-subunit alcohol dehydrogenase family)